MLKNYLTFEKYQYFDLYLDIYTNKINSIINNNIIFFINNNIQKIESIIQKKIKNHKNKSFNIYIYIPILLTFPKNVNIIDYLKQIQEIDIITIISIFLNKEIYVNLEEKNKIIFKSIYCGKTIDNYKNYIENGGYFKKNGRRIF